MTMESIYREIGICSQVLSYGERVEASLKNGLKDWTRRRNTTN